MKLLSKALPPLEWYIADRTFNADEIVEAEFATNNFTTISCYQFALKHDSKLEFQEIVPSGVLKGLGLEDFSWFGRPGYRLQAGEIRNVWSNPYGSTVANEILFKIKFKATQAGTLSQSLTLWANHPVLKPRAYKFPLVPTTLTLNYLPPVQQSVLLGV